MYILINLKNLLLSPRFTTFYWNSGLVLAVNFINLLVGSIAEIGLPAWAVVVIGLGLAQVTKALSNLMKKKDMGFFLRKK